MGIQEAYEAHRDELADALTPERRMKIMMTWRKMIDQEAHDYADMVLSHPKRDEIKQTEIEIYMHAYMGGYMAGRGWIQEAEAHQAAFSFGRGLRDHLRRLGVPLEDLMLTLGVVMDDALRAIVALGLEDGVADHTDPRIAKN